MFWLRNKENIFQLYSRIWSPVACLATITREQITKGPISSLHGCTCWSSPLFFECSRHVFLPQDPYGAIISDHDPIVFLTIRTQVSDTDPCCPPFHQDHSDAFSPQVD